MVKISAKKKNDNQALEVRKSFELFHPPAAIWWAAKDF